VVSDNEKQFKIARKSLIDVLNAYNELAGVEMAYVTAQNDYRMAALAYLRAQAGISNWMRQ
jgi:adhesin transport system outer membrane protein